jgi:hypothetical protein
MKIITRGLGKNPPGVQGMITMGFGKKLLETVIRIVKKGQAGTKRALQELQEVVVWAGLISVNDKKPEKKVQGFVRVRINSAARYAVSAAQLVSSRIRSAFEDIKINIKRINKDN